MESSFLEVFSVHSAQYMGTWFDGEGGGSVSRLTVGLCDH